MNGASTRARRQSRGRPAPGRRARAPAPAVEPGTRSAGEDRALPSTRPGDPGTVRVLSIHKAKGLEAPIVLLFDSADDFRPRPDGGAPWDTGAPGVGFRGGCQPPNWDALVKQEEGKAWAEARRLLY